MVEKMYWHLKKLAADAYIRLVPYFRRFLRLCALPHCFFSAINWDICPRSRVYVAWDLLYIFFRLKYYPENYSLCHLWGKERSSWGDYYGSIYDAYQRGRLRQKVQEKKYQILFEDKYICYQLCKAACLPLPKHYACLYPNDNYREIIRKVIVSHSPSGLIIKPVLGKGGMGLFLVTCDAGNGNIIVSDTSGQEVELGDFHLETYSVLQERVEQHPVLSTIARSTNTFRIVTLLTKSGKILVLGTKLRLGRHNSFIDNTSSGGIGVGINLDTGVLLREGFDAKSRVYTSHPSSKIVFDGFQVPEWQKIINLAKRIQSHFNYYLMLGSDIALTVNGPVVIEINSAHDNIKFEQSCGPILANEEVRKAFQEYNLLIN